MTKKKTSPIDASVDAGETHVLGTGEFGWNRGERVTDRYGAVSVYLPPKPGTWEQDVDLDLRTLRKLKGRRGNLVAVVVEPRESDHLGDFFRGVGPKKAPKEGARVVLSKEPGTFFYEERGENGSRCVGIRPDDGRESDWLDPRKLYSVHSSIVRLVFEECP